LGMYVHTSCSTLNLYHRSAVRKYVNILKPECHVRSFRRLKWDLLYTHSTYQCMQIAHYGPTNFSSFCVVVDQMSLKFHIPGSLTVAFMLLFFMQKQQKNLEFCRNVCTGYLKVQF